MDADIHSVTVPGAADGWSTAVAKWGKLSLSEVLEPAAVLADEGFPVNQFCSKGWGAECVQCSAVQSSPVQLSLFLVTSTNSLIYEVNCALVVTH